MSRWVYSACLAGFLLLGAGPDALIAQSLQMTPATGGADRPAARAARVAEGPTVDGDVLGDPIWQQAAPIEGFKQYQPNEGQPVSERTEVRMAFTRNTLYIGVVCYDSDPNGIIVTDSRRDSSLDNTDRDSKTGSSRQ